MNTFCNPCFYLKYCVSLCCYLAYHRNQSFFTVFMGGQPWSTLTHLVSKILWPDLTECDIKMSTLSVFYAWLHTALELISQVLACCPGSYLLQVNNMLLRSVPVINHCNVLMLFHLVLVINQMSQWILLFILCVSNIFGLRLEACSSSLAAHTVLQQTYSGVTQRREAVTQ